MLGTLLNREAGWLILKNWIAKDVALEVNDFNNQATITWAVSLLTIWKIELSINHAMLKCINQLKILQKCVRGISPQNAK